MRYDFKPYIINDLKNYKKFKINSERSNKNYHIGPRTELKINKHNFNMEYHFFCDIFCDDDFNYILFVYDNSTEIISMNVHKRGIFQPLLATFVLSKNMSEEDEFEMSMKELNYDFDIKENRIFLIDYFKEIYEFLYNKIIQ